MRFRDRGGRCGKRSVHQGCTSDSSSELARGCDRKLDALNFATVLDDLRSPAGNRLEALHGDRDGQHSIRINDQYRICFTWSRGEAVDVEIVDYH